MSSVFEHLDQVVDRLGGLRDVLLADEAAPARASRLAMVFAAEAEAWSQVYELAHLRLVWRAALAAEAGARANAALWAGRAGDEQTGSVPATSSVTGRVSTPGPVALTTSSTEGDR